MILDKGVYELLSDAENSASDEVYSDFVIQ
jgi:hypothetical protein